MSLVAINALVNFIGANSLILGYLYFKHQRQSSEQWCMNISFFAFLLFLSSLLICIYEINIQRSAFLTIPYAIFSAMLTIHILLALSLPILILFAIWTVLTGRFHRYRKKLIVYWVFPVWIFATLTGVYLYYFSGSF